MRRRRDRRAATERAGASRTAGMVDGVRGTGLALRLVLGLAVAVGVAACGSTSRHIWANQPPATSHRAGSDHSAGQYRVELHWRIGDRADGTRYDVFVNGRRAAGSRTSPYVLSRLSCGATYTLGVRADDARGRISPLFVTTYRTPRCPPRPAGVGLQQIDGGPHYYCAHRFTNACKAGWDDPSFFPISQDYFYCSQPASAWTREGLNVADRFNNDCTPKRLSRTLRSHHLWAIAGDDKYSGPPGNVTTGFGERTLGWDVQEPTSWTQITGTADQFARFSKGGMTGRFLQAIFTADQYSHAPLAGDGVRSSVPRACGPESMRTVMTCTRGMPGGRHIDMVTADTYWFAGSGRDNRPAPYYSDFCTRLYGGHRCTSAQIGRGSNYGDMVDMMRSWTPAPHVPAGAIIETGNGYAEGGRDITPAEFNWAAWDTIVHGARWLLYFTEGSAPASAGFPTRRVGGTTMAAQGQATDHLVEGLAPIIQSPFALKFARADVGGYVFPKERLVLDGGVDMSVHYYSGAPFTNRAGTFGPGFYILFAVRGSETQTMPRTYRFTLPGSDATSSGNIQDVCACSPKQSTGAVSYDARTHSFSDTVKKVTDVHIIGPFQ